MPWTEVTGSAQTWGASTHSLAASVASRFNRIDPQADSANTDVNFIYRISVPGSFFVASGVGVPIMSTITVGV